MSWSRAGLIGGLVAVVLLAVPTSAAAEPPTVITYEQAIGGFSGDLGDGALIDAIFDAFNYTQDGQSATTASVHAEVNADRLGLVCDADGPATLQIADDLSGATLSATLQGACTDVRTFQTLGIDGTVEIEPGAFHQLQRVDELCVTPGRSS